MNNYYAPTIEEFHVGFEFEVYNKHYKNFIENEWAELTYRGESIDLIENGLKTNIIRVKYLNTKDIESLNFCPPQPEFSHPAKFLFLHRDIDNLYIDFLSYYDEKHRDIITIFKRDVTKDINREILFKGNVKNKLELKKLLHN